MKKLVVTKNQVIEFVMVAIFVVIPFLTLFILASPMGGRIISTQVMTLYGINYIFLGSVSLIWIVYLFDYVKKREPKAGRYVYVEFIVITLVVLWILFGFVTSMMTVILMSYLFHPIIYFILSIVSSMTLGLYMKMFKHH